MGSAWQLGSCMHTTKLARAHEVGGSAMRDFAALLFLRLGHTPHLSIVVTVLPEKTGSVERTFQVSSKANTGVYTSFSFSAIFL